MMLRYLFAPAIILSCVTSAHAELTVVEFGVGYRIRVTETISDGTAAALVELVNERGSFPDALLLSAAGGEIAAGMEFGRFIRSAMLPVSAGRSCGEACMLAWAGGVRRNTRGPLPLSAAAADETTLAYLAEMGATQPDLATSPTVPGTHLRWLTENCGSLNEQQRADLEAARALQAMEASLDAMAMGGMGGQSNYTVDADTQRAAARAGAVPLERRAASLAAEREIDTCRARAIAEVRKPLLE